jgi:hypothetical protein
MGADEQEALEDSFELEVSQLPGTSPGPVLPWMPQWHARQPDVIFTAGERLRRYSRGAALVAIVCLILANSLNLTQLFSADLSLTSAPISAPRLTAHTTGTGWFALGKQPLHLPTLLSQSSCPVTPMTTLTVGSRTVRGIGDSSIFASTPNADANGVQHPQRSNFFRGRTTWRGEIVTWYLNLPTVEPVYIRGAQLDGPNILLFDGGIQQPNFANNLMNGSMLPQLLISNTSNRGSPVSSWLTITRISHSGCYAYQVDTPTTSLVLVFKAVIQP